MVSKGVKAVIAQVLDRVSPKVEERAKILGLARRCQRKVRKSLNEMGMQARVRIEGSVAKDTWLSGEADVDIFMCFDVSVPKRRFRPICLKVARKVFKDVGWIERFAEHPYVEAWINGTRINIVPCYKSKRGEWLSATDRTPFHTRYIKRRLSEDVKKEIRLLKRFMKGVGVYGAEIKVGGFSGYLSELLILHFGSFLNTLRNAHRLGKDIIDLEGYYEGRYEEAKRFFMAPVIVVDPIDKYRNVAAALSIQRVSEFIAASKAFLSEPSLTFFYPLEVTPYPLDVLLTELKSREAGILVVKAGRVVAVPDVLWGQLYRSMRAIAVQLKQFEFKVLRSTAWSDEESAIALIFELESTSLPSIKKHLGPPVESKEARSFLEKHLGAPTTYSGPWIEEGRWVVETRRRYTNAVTLLRDLLSDGGETIGVAGLISQAFKKSLRIMVNEEVADFYSTNINFAKFFTEFVVGKPPWLQAA
jgi:tRNA nucleotidyltransferase (CCA-adding enzyme)